MTHADRDGSERELSAYLAADKAEPAPDADRVNDYAEVIESRFDQSKGGSLYWTDVARAVIALADRERADDKARIAQLEAWQREVCDYYGYDSEAPSATAEVLTYLPAWLAESSAEREALADAQAKVARVEALAAEWEKPGVRINTIRSEVIAHHLRAALDSPADEHRLVGASESLGSWAWYCACGAAGGACSTERVAKYRHLLHRNEASKAAGDA